MTTVCVLKILYRFEFVLFAHYEIIKCGSGGENKVCKNCDRSIYFQLKPNQ